MQYFTKCVLTSAIEREDFGFPNLLTDLCATTSILKRRSIILKTIRSKPDYAKSKATGVSQARGIERINEAQAASVS